MLVEADFQREYRIDLVQDLGRMSWRRLAILLRGLGPNSASATRAHLRKYDRTGGHPDEPEAPATSTAQDFRMLFGGAYLPEEEKA